MAEVLCTTLKRRYRTKKYRPVDILLGDLSREEVAKQLHMTSRTLQELLRLAAQHIEGFDKYLNDECRLNGHPIKYQHELDLIAEIYRLRSRYKGVKDGSLMLKEDLVNLNEKYKQQIKEQEDEQNQD